jgi:gliding motility-associated-like protein
MNLFTSPKKHLLLFSFLLVIFCQVAHATAYQSTGAGGAWNNSASWSPAGIPGAGDNVTINGSSPIQITAPAACATITINAGAILTMTSSVTVTSSFNVNGTLNCNQNFVFGACSFTLANNNNAFLMIGDPNGITTNPTALGNIENTGSRNYPPTANYIYNGIANQSTGNGLPTNINGGGSLSINNTGASSSNIVTLTAAAPSIQNINLQSGLLSLNGKTITVNGTILNSGGDLDSSIRANGGTIIVQGATISGPTTFYNLTCNSSNSTITTSGLSSPLINGTMLINSRFSGINSPRYAKGSTLSYAGTANNRGLEWNADLSTTPTLGVTQGYPDNVLINTGSDFYIVDSANNAGLAGNIPRGLAGNLTTGELTMYDYYPWNASHNPALIQTAPFTVGGKMIINGTGNIHMAPNSTGGSFSIADSLTINGAGANLNMNGMTALFSVGKTVTINNGKWNVGYSGAATNIQINEDLNNNGGTINDSSGVIHLIGGWKRTAGIYNGLNGTIEFDGTASQLINDNTPGGVNFNNVIINNNNDIGMTSGVTINGNLTFIKGLFLTYSSANLTIGASGNIIGASQSTGWVAKFSGGSLIRNINNTSPYLFAIGNINFYTPVTLTFSSVTAPGTVAMNAGGPFPSTMPGYATYGLSKTDYLNWYWYINKLSGTFGSYNADLNYGTVGLIGAASISTLKAGVYDGSNWTYPASSGSGTTVTATNITPLNGSLENIGLANSTCTTPTVYNVTGTGSYCTGTGLNVGLDNSQIGVNYQLQTAGPINVGTPIAGTGSPISFGNQTMGTYTVVATNAVTSTCTSNMAGNAVITMGIPTAPTYTGIPPAEICINNTVNYTTQLGQSNYVWTVPGVLGTDYAIVSGGIGSTNPTVNLTWLTSGTKTVTVNYTSGGCTGAAPATNTTVVDTLPVPTFTTAPSGSVCENSSVTYTTQTGQVFYNWTVSGVSGTDYTITSGGISNTDNTVTLTWLTNGSKTVTVNYYNNLTAFCAGAIPASSTITINTPPTPTFTAEAGPTACSKAAVTYTTQSGETNYVWTFGVPADYAIITGGSATDNTVTLKWLTAGNKTVTINYTDVNGCSATSATTSTTTAVTIGPDASNLTIASATAVCTGSGSGSTITVNSTSLQDDTYTVAYTLGTPNTAIVNTSMVFIAGTGTFTVPSGNLSTAGSTSITITTIANSGCSAIGLTATNTIVVGTTPTPTFTTEPGVAACTNSIVTYTTQSGESNYAWAFGVPADYSIVSGGSATDTTTTLKWLTAGNKTVTINYTNGSCTATTPTSSVTTSVSVGPDASDLAITATNVCLGASGSVITVNSTTLHNDTYNVTYSLGTPNATTSIVSMNFAGGTGTFTVPSGSLHAAGSTSITITALSNSGCTTSGLSATNLIVVGTVPVPTFTAEPTNTCYHTDVIYTTQSGQADYVWDFGGSLNTDYSIVSGGSSTDNTATLQWITTGSKTVKVNYNNTNNCSAVTPASTTATINNCLPLIVPSAFAPGGKNAVWHIKNGENYPNMQVKVFDRWGKIVYQCTGNPSWDGTYQGQNLSMDTYIYEINANDAKYPQVLKGSVTLVR